MSYNHEECCHCGTRGTRRVGAVAAKEQVEPAGMGPEGQSHKVAGVATRLLQSGSMEAEPRVE